MDDLSNYAVGGYLPTSFLDWRGRVAAVIFTSGCNFRCPWCHNGELALGSGGEIPLGAVLQDIKRRSQFLDGVVISGGEPTQWPGRLRLLSVLKDASLPVKLDTNGSDPELLRRILEAGLVEYVAMDVKAPFDDELLARAAGVPVSAAVLLESVEIIRRLAPSYELRTTWSPGILSVNELLRLGGELAGDPNWVVQPFVPNGCLDPAYGELPRITAEEIRSILPEVKIRG